LRLTGIPSIAVVHDAVVGQLASRPETSTVTVVVWQWGMGF